MIVSKFGGSSVADAVQFQKVKDIVTKNEQRCVVVVSALGKKSPDDIKTTDLLYLLHDRLKSGAPYEDVFCQIKQNFFAIQHALGLKTDLAAAFSSFEEELCQSTSADYVASRGEYFTARLMAEFLGYAFVDAKDVIRLFEDGAVDYAATCLLLQNALKQHGKLVLPGFYAALPNGKIKTFSRGGSDVSGAIAAGALAADCYENWTDVSGVLLADPGIVKDAKRIDHISYSELRALSYMGASVLHEETILPVRSANIPIRILNTNRPDGKGTLVSANCDKEPYLIKGIAGKKDFSAFVITREAGVSKTTLIGNVLQLLSEHEAEVEQISSSVDSISFVVSNKQIAGRHAPLALALKECPYVSDVKIERDIALISVLARSLVALHGTAASILGVFAEAGVNVKLITYGVDDSSIIVGICAEQYEKSIAALYERLSGLNCSA